MVKPQPRKQSGLGFFGGFVIALGLFFAFIKSDIAIAGASVGAGVFLIILSLFLERLDTIIDLLRQIVDSSEHKEQSNPGSENKS